MVSEIRTFHTESSNGRAVFKNNILTFSGEWTINELWSLLTSLEEGK